MGRPDGETAVRELDMRVAKGVKFFQVWELEMFISVTVIGQGVK
jgi:hypothetical protein